MGLIVFVIIMSIITLIVYKVIDNSINGLWMGVSELVFSIFFIIMILLTLLGTIIYFYI